MTSSPSVRSRSTSSSSNDCWETSSSCSRSSSSSSVVGGAVPVVKPIAPATLSEECLKFPDAQKVSLKFDSIVLGLLVGFFLQLSTVGVHNYWAMMVQNSDSSANWGRSDKWNAFFVSSTLAWFVIAVTATALLAILRPIQDSLLHGNFVSSTIIGLGLAWNTMDCCLGRDINVFKSCSMVGIALAWCKVIEKAGLLKMKVQ